MTLCAHCGGSLVPEELRCAACGLPAPPPVSLVSESELWVLACSRCDAVAAYDPTVGTPLCAFCGSATQTATPDQPLTSIERFVPFRLSPRQARAALLRWLGPAGWFTPKDLHSCAFFSPLRPLWWAAWSVTAEVRVTWSADTDGGTRRAGRAPHAGQFNRELRDVIVPASAGFSDDECQALGRHCDIEQATPSPQVHPDATAELFCAPRPSPRTLAPRLRAAAKCFAIRKIPGNDHRNLHVGVLPLRLATVNLGLPAYVSVYRYRGKVYRAIVHGQNAECVVGEMPRSVSRIAAAWGLGALLLAAVAWATIALVL